MLKRDDETWIRIPQRDAPVEDLLDFAGTYNAYEFFATEPDRLQHLLGDLYEEIARSLVVPEWVRLDLARAVLFYAYRLDYFSGGVGPSEPMAELVDRIRVLSGGSVTLRIRPAPAHGAVTSGNTDTTTTTGGFVDSWAYSDDEVYRWWYERRWEAGPSLCFVGLNPATGDTDGKPRPTLAKVVNWAKREGCGAVVVVNLFAFRSTNPRNVETFDQWQGGGVRRTCHRSHVECRLLSIPPSRRIDDRLDSVGFQRFWHRRPGPGVPVVTMARSSSTPSPSGRRPGGPSARSTPVQFRLSILGSKP